MKFHFVLEFPTRFFFRVGVPNTVCHTAATAAVSGGGAAARRGAAAAAQVEVLLSPAHCIQPHMPKFPWVARTPRQRMIRFIRKVAWLYVVLGDSKRVRQYGRLLHWLLSRRYLVPHVHRIPQDRAHLEFLLKLPAEEFRNQCRLTPDTFQRLLELISQHDVFISTGLKPQRSVCEQLFSFLVFAGHDGSGVGRSFTVKNLGSSTGSAFNFSSRVVTALLAFKSDFIKWPNYKEQQTLAARYAATHSLPHVFGAIDGTHFFFFQQPKHSLSPQQYWTRKKGGYGMLCLIACDIDGNIIWYDLGWPGSVQDIKALEKSALHADWDKVVKGGLCLAGDKGFVPTMYVVTPYEGAEAERETPTIYNEQHKKGRVIVERLNGILKLQFMSLRGMRIAVRKKKDVQRACDFCSALMIVHNFCNLNRSSWIAPSDPVERLECEEWKDAENKLFAKQERAMVKKAVEVGATLREAQLAFRDRVALDCVHAVTGTFMRA